MVEIGQSLVFLLAGLVCLGLAWGPESVFAKRFWIKSAMAVIIVARFAAYSFAGFEIRVPMFAGAEFFLDLGSFVLFIYGVVVLGRRENSASAQPANNAV